MKKKALITGITGQDGSYLAEFLLKENPHPLILVGLIIFLKTQNINQNSFCIMET